MGLVAKSLVSMVCAMNLGSPNLPGYVCFVFFFASSTWLCPTLYLFPDLCSRCLKVSYPELSTVWPAAWTRPTHSGMKVRTSFFIFMSRHDSRRISWNRDSAINPSSSTIQRRVANIQVSPLPWTHTSRISEPNSLSHCHGCSFKIFFYIVFQAATQRLALAIKMKAICHSWWRALPPLNVSMVQGDFHFNRKLQCGLLACLGPHLALSPLTPGFSLQLGCLKVKSSWATVPRYGLWRLCFWEFGILWRPVKPFFCQYTENSYSPHSTGCSQLASPGAY